MKQFSRKIYITLVAASLTVSAFAGNKDRSGQAGATELLINPWAASTGVFGLNVANVKGMEAMKNNIAGLSYVDGTEIGFSYGAYLRGSQVNISNLGFAQKLGDIGVIGINLQSMGFGEIDVTSFDLPDGGAGTFKPQFFNIQLGYAKSFSRAIHAGIGVTYVSEAISNIRASGACFEAGVQYVTGERDNFHFGVTLRNVGTNMRYSGEGFAINSEAPEDETYVMNRETPADKFEMPTYLSIGASYDFFLDEKRLQNENDQPKHRLTAMLAFTSNSFNNDYIGAGLEYGFREQFMLRAGYRYEKDIASVENSTTFYTGISAGATVNKKLGSKPGSPNLAIDYSFRPTRRPDNGVHMVSLRFLLHGKNSAERVKEIENAAAGK
jgi:hypothetical protein